MAEGFSVEEPEYGAKKKQEESLRSVPLPREDSFQPPIPETDAPQPVESGIAETPGMAALAPHTQKHLWSANEFMRLANGQRPGIPGVSDENINAISALGNIAMQIAEATGDPDMYAAVEEIMEMGEGPYNYLTNFAQAKMDDINIAEGVLGEHLGQPEVLGVEPVEADGSVGERKPETGRPE